jgi:hypothetical protein
VNRQSLPEPACCLGYTRKQIAEIMGPRLAEFDRWMRGQTQALCEGREYDHATKSYRVACGGVAHGGITYPWDVERFLAGLPALD